MTNTSSDIDELVTRAANGDPIAVDHLMELHRERLRRMVAVRLNPMIANRVDASDIVQEAMTEATKRLKEYAENQTVAFYPWLRRIAWQRLQKTHRFHISANRRSVTREEAIPSDLADDSVIDLAKQLVQAQATPSESLMFKELMQRVRLALESLPPNDREVLVLRYLEQVSLREIAEIVEASEDTVKKRHARALHKLQTHLASDHQ